MDSFWPFFVVTNTNFDFKLTQFYQYSIFLESDTYYIRFIHCKQEKKFFFPARITAVWKDLNHCFLKKKITKIFFVQHPGRKCDFGGSLTDDEVIDSSIDDVIVEETRFHPLVGEVKKRSMINAKEVTKDSDAW